MGPFIPAPLALWSIPGLYGVDPFKELPHASTLCGACQEVCPVRIDIPRMLLKLRQDVDEIGGNPAWLKAGISSFAFAAQRPALFHMGGNLSGRATQILAKEDWINKLPGPLASWTNSRDFPAFAKKSFRDRWRKERG